MGEFSIGQSVRRREDPRLLMGRGRYFDDLKLADQFHAAIVRSPHAHADIKSIDTRAALQMPGVHAVLTGKDYDADGLGTMPSMAPYKRRDGGPMYLPHRPAIAIDRVLHVGYPVAVVVADTLDLARDAAERVEVDYAPRPAVVSAREAFEPGAPQLYDDCPNNEAYFYQAGDKATTDAAFANAAHVIEQRLVINRVTANTLEPRGVTGEYDRGTGRYTLHCGFQRPWLFRNAIAETTMKIPEAQLRLITGDIGGSYGLRGSVYPEIILMLWAARRVGRPVKWTCTRNEAHISDDDARDNIVDAALALDQDGKFLGVRIRSFGNLGAFVSFRGAMPPVVNIGTVVRRLHDAGAACRDLRHADQHALHLALSRRRPARGVLHDRAADRHRRRRNEDRPGGAAAAQHHSAVGDALQDAAHLHLRQRALRGEHGPRHEARRLGGLRGAAQGGGEARHAARHRHLQHHRAGRRSDHRDRGNPLRSARRHDLRHRLDLARPGPQHDPDADAGRPARRRSRADQVHPGRHRRGRLRHGHRRLALDHHERRRHRHGQRQDHRQGQEARRAYPRSGGGRHGVQGRPLHHRRHRPRHRHPRGGEGGVPAGEAAARHGARPLRDRDLSRPHRQFPERRPRLRGRDRSRDRRDDRWSATGWWTTSAPSSTRCW